MTSIIKNRIEAAYLAMFAGNYDSAILHAEMAQEFAQTPKERYHLQGALEDIRALQLNKPGQTRNQN